MGKYMENESLDIMVSAIVDKALEEYKQKLIENVEKHYENRYCAKAGTVKVATKNEIMKIIDRTVCECKDKYFEKTEEELLEEYIVK